MEQMKKSFSSNSQVAHVWAQQTQEEGKSKNMFFVNKTDLYSYGFHYLAAKIHTLKDGTKVALIRSDSYSTSTGGHLRDAERAVRDLMLNFRVPNVKMLNSTENFNHFNDMVLDRIEQILKSVKVTSKRDLNWPIESLEHAVEESNQFFKIAGFPTIELPSSLMEVMKDHLQFRLKRYEELNTPEMIAKLEVEKKKREEQKQKKQIESLKQDIENWRNFTFSSLHSLRNLPFALLRVRGSEVETSAGAQVPLSHALRLLSHIESGDYKAGEKVGHFSFESVQGNNAKGEETFVKIGCHKILLSEAQNVLAPYRGAELKLAEVN
jgi:hypothetical protein